MRTTLAPTADDLWAQLDPAQNCWTEGSESWIFRGQGDATWDLLPSAWRPLKINKLSPLIEGQSDGISEKGWKKWVSAERIAIGRFILKAEEMGFDTRTEPALFDPLKLIDFEETVDGTPWIHDVAAGLAQHHGIPTRLLDWTRDPRIALHFALNNSEHKEDAESAVFGLNLEKLLDGYRERRLVGDSLHKPPKLIRVQATSIANPFLRLQRGVLTAITSEQDFFRENDRFPSIVDYVKLFHWPRGKALPWEMMRIRTEWKARLRSKLQRAGIVRAMLMPTLDNVACDVLENLHDFPEKTDSK